MTQKIKKHFQLPIIYVIVILLCFYPYVFNLFLNIGSETIYLLVFFGITVLMLFITKKKEKIPSWFKNCLYVQMIAWILYMLLHSDTSYLVRVFFIILSTCLLFLLLRKNLLLQFANTYNHFIALQAILGVPIFFLFAFGMVQPLSVFNNIDGRDIYFFGITFSNAITSGIIRIAGFFDEPGALAFWGIFALIFNKLTYDNKGLEIILIIGLCFTLSAAYFIQIVMYIALFYGSKVKYLTSIILILGTVGFFTVKYVGQNEQLAYLTTERFQGGTIRSQRIMLAEDTKKIFEASPIFGIGAKNLEASGYYADNPYEILAKDGLIGLLVTYLPLFVVLFRFGLRDNKVLFACLLLIAGYLQRPFHVNLLHSLMLYLFVLIVHYRKKRYEVR